MTEAKKTRIIIPLVGIAAGTQQPRAVYDPLSHKVLSAMGTVSTMRASHVDVGRDLRTDALEVLTNSRELNYAIDSDQGYVIHPDYAEHWFADMTPTGHRVVLGPYNPDSRDVALQEEVAWLQAHNIPTCQSCTTAQLIAHGQAVSEHESSQNIRKPTCNVPAEPDSLLPPSSPS